MILIQGQCEPLPDCQMLDLVYTKDRWPGPVHHRETKLNQQLTKHGTFSAWGDSATCCKVFRYKETIQRSLCFPLEHGSVCIIINGIVLQALL